MRCKTFLLCAIVSFFIASCTLTVRLRVIKPAEIALKPHIKTIAVIDRTKPSNKVLNVVEGVITGEGIFQDAQASQETVSGFIDKLKGSPRFEVVRTGVRLRGSRVGKNFTKPLPWHEIEKYCSKHNADAVASLELFDTDFIITDGTKEVTRKDDNGNEYKETVFTAQGVAKVKVGFRIYDPTNKEIADEFVFNRSRTWIAEGITVKEALAALINRRDAVKKVSYTIGTLYGYKISPNWVTVKRMLYKKSKHSPDIALGRRRADVNDWEGAAVAWEKATNSSHRETAGKAAYNLAVAKEVLGGLDEAKLWAQKAYTDFGNKDAKNYVRVLNYRILEEERLKEQMGE